MTKTLKMAAIVANFVLFGSAMYLFQRYGTSNPSEVFYFILMASVPVLNMIFIFNTSERDGRKEDNLLTLFIKRKTLEEKNKIKRIKDSDEGR